MDVGWRNPKSTKPVADTVLDVDVAVGCWMLDVGCWMLDVGCWMPHLREDNGVTSG